MKRSRIEQCQDDILLHYVFVHEECGEEAHRDGRLLHRIDDPEEQEHIAGLFDERIHRIVHEMRTTSRNVLVRTAEGEHRFVCPTDIAKTDTVVEDNELVDRFSTLFVQSLNQAVNNMRVFPSRTKLWRINTMVVDKCAADLLPSPNDAPPVAQDGVPSPIFPDAIPGIPNPAKDLIDAFELTEDQLKQLAQLRDFMKEVEDASNGEFPLSAGKYARRLLMLWGRLFSSKSFDQEAYNDIFLLVKEQMLTGVALLEPVFEKIHGILTVDQRAKISSPMWITSLATRLVQSRMMQGFSPCCPGFVANDEDGDDEEDDENQGAPPAPVSH